MLKEYKNKIESAAIIDSEKSFQFILDQVAKLYEARDLIESIKTAALSLKKGEDVIEVKAILKKKVNILLRDNEDSQGDWVGDYAKRKQVVEKRATTGEEESENEQRAIPTGIRRFDQLVGGLMPAEFGVIAGKPGIGKTICMVDFAAYAYKLGYNVAYFTGEMPKIDIQFRLDAHIAGIPSQKFRNGDLDKKELHRWHKTIEQYRIAQSNYLEVVAFARGFNTSDIEAACIKMQDKWQEGVQIIFIDYLNIMGPDGRLRGRGGKDWEAQADVVWDVKGLIAEFNGGIRGWTANQIVDAAYEKTSLEIADLKYARAIGETAPVVVGLIETPNDILEDRIQFQVIKMRNAEKFDRMIYLHPNKSLMRMHEAISTQKDLNALEDDTGKPEKKTNKYKSNQL